MRKQWEQTILELINVWLPMHSCFSCGLFQMYVRGMNIEDANSDEDDLMQTLELDFLWYTYLTKCEATIIQAENVFRSVKSLAESLKIDLDGRIFHVPFHCWSETCQCEQLYKEVLFHKAHSGRVTLIKLKEVFSSPLLYECSVDILEQRRIPPHMKYIADGIKERCGHILNEESLKHVMDKTSELFIMLGQLLHHISPIY